MGLKLLVTAYAIGTVFLVAGILSIALSDTFIRNMVKSSIKLVPNTDYYNQWLNPPVDVYMSFFLFNLTNSDDFVKGNKPVFDEIGPFIYKEVYSKEDIVDNLNYTLTYKERRRYTFLPELSAFNESINITTINMAAVAVISQIKYSGSLIHFFVDTAITASGETMIVTKSVRDLLFGYKDPFLSILKTIAPSMVPTEYVGLFYGKNFTIDGLYTVFTGEDDYEKVGRIEKFNNMDILPYWTTYYANLINGTDGTMFSPFLNKNKMYVFESDICRSLYLTYTHSDKTAINNIEVYVYEGDEYFFANASVNPDNEGFCTPHGNCMGAGVLNLTNCLQGLPIVMSCPHFLYADEKYLLDVEGIQPNYSIHHTELHIEPITGVPMKANKRVQFNTPINKEPKITIASKLPEVLYPLFWIDEHFTIDKKNADKFYNGVKLPIILLNTGKFVIFALSILILILCILTTIRRWHQSRMVYTTVDEQQQINWDVNDTNKRSIQQNNNDNLHQNNEEEQQSS